MDYLSHNVAVNLNRIRISKGMSLDAVSEQTGVSKSMLAQRIQFDDTIGGVDVKHGCFDRHLLITAIGAHIIRMVPPLIVSEEDCDKAYEIIKETVESLSTK